MWPSRAHQVDQIEKALAEFSSNKRPMPGQAEPAHRRSLALQIVASVRRLEYTEILKARPIDPARSDPNSPMFDPERAAIIFARSGDLDEAFWITFLATHFGKHGQSGWKRLADVYSGIGSHRWTWVEVTRDFGSFSKWFSENYHRVGGGFSNHRKYESLRPNSAKGTLKVIESYIEWVGPEHSHSKLVARLTREGGNDPSAIFDRFYTSMKVLRFGRLGKFDFLALVGRLELAPIAPGRTYLQGATGPLRGARLLFGGAVDHPLHIDSLELWIVELDQSLNVGMQVMEDSLCNWQKSPASFKHFKG